MKGTMIVIGTDGSMQRRELGSPVNLLPVLQKEVGGYVEVVPYFKTFVEDGEEKPCVALCNEEGKLDGLPYNSVATELWHDGLRKQFPSLGMPMAGASIDVLVGPVLIIMGDDEFMEEF